MSNSPECPHPTDKLTWLYYDKNAKKHVYRCELCKFNVMLDKMYNFPPEKK